MFKRIQRHRVVAQRVHVQQLDGDGAVPAAAVHGAETTRADHFEQFQLIVGYVPFFHG